MDRKTPLVIEKVHTSSYPAIDPTQPDLSTAGKTVIIVCNKDDNQSAAIAIADSFATSGASNIVFIDSSATGLTSHIDEVKQRHSSTKWLVIKVDVTSPESVGVAAHSIRESMGAWHVFIHAGLAAPPPTTLAGADTDAWWLAFEQNVKFIHLFTKHFMPKARPNATYVARFPRTKQGNARQSALLASQSAVLKLNEHLAMEHPSLRVFNVFDGARRQSIDLGNEQERGKVNAESEEHSKALHGNFCVWLSSPDQDFLRGSLLSCEWDASELVAKKIDIESDPGLLAETLHSDHLEQKMS